MADDGAYLSVLDWPEDIDLARKVETLANAAGFDSFHAKQHAVRATPIVIGPIERPRAEHGLEVLYRAGATAFAPLASEIDGVGPARRARRLVSPAGAPPGLYLAEMWREDSVGLRMEEVELLVRARVRSTERQTTLRPNRSHSVARGYLVGGAVGAFAAAAADGMDSGVSHSVTTRETHVLDLHRRDGSLIRLDGDKFCFDVLGPERGFSDGASMDSLAVRLAEEAPGAIVDTGFERFRPPPEVIRAWTRNSRAGSSTRTFMMPAFDFYTAWVRLMYRRLLGS